MLLEIWSDIACPFCFIGKRNVEAALHLFDHRDEVEVRWRSFQLAPDAPPTSDLYDALARKYGATREQVIERNAGVLALGAESGIEFDMDRVRMTNTFDAHRVLQLGIARGHGDAVKERMLVAYFQEGALLADHETLLRLATEAGLPAAKTAAVLASDAYAAEVRGDITQAQEFGLNAVPAFILDRRFGLTGAQPPAVLVQDLQRAWDLQTEA